MSRRRPPRERDEPGPGQWRRPRVAGTVHGSDREALAHVLRGMADDLRDEPERVLVRRRTIIGSTVVLAAMLGAAVIALSVAVTRHQYEFRQVQGNGAPVRWNGCEQLHYVVNARSAGTEQVSEVHAAFAQASRITGIRMVYDGLTDERASSDRMPVQYERYGHRWAPVLVAWTATGDGTLRLPFSTHGQAITEVRREPVAGEKVYVTGQLLLNADRKADYANAPPTSFTVRHELGHLLGLAHVNDGRQVMHYASTAENRRKLWARGDLVGLRRLGRSSGCPAASPLLPTTSLLR